MCDSDYDYRSEQAYNLDMLSTGDVLCDCGARVPADDMTSCAACGRDACPDCIRDTLSHLKVCCSDCELQVLERYLTSGVIVTDWRLSNQPDWRARAQAETDTVAKRIAELNDAMLPELVSRSLLELRPARRNDVDGVWHCGYHRAECHRRHPQFCPAGQEGWVTGTAGTVRKELPDT